MSKVYLPVECAHLLALMTAGYVREGIRFEVRMSEDHLEFVITFAGGY